MYYYSDLTSTEPAGVARQLELGETRRPTVNAHVDINVDLTAGPLTVPNAKNSLYGKCCDTMHFEKCVAHCYLYIYL